VGGRPALGVRLLVGAADPRPPAPPPHPSFG